MKTLTLIGIGTGNPDHLTLQAIKALNAAALILIPRKGPEKDDLAELRRSICADVITAPVTIAEFDLPKRDTSNPSYTQGVLDWHDAIAEAWQAEIARHPTAQSVALLVWGDPSLYDSTLRIAARLAPQPEITVIPGITSALALTASHAIPVNEIGAPFLTTTGRHLRDHGWPDGVDTLVVMLDGGCAFQVLQSQGITIYWAAYVGMENEIALSGPLETTGPKIIEARAAARADHGWIMDIYLLRREAKAG
ncbi:precorrin-6A synthase (deacetylating) [Alphaproteobacteria bacterium KMM 3653]|uniref:Precorrin-6A synthase [deacetylating] n=1 Tax=Harenicola maris TaxID=2841044 RepID=A0AAP2G2G1_9RHOB|nr:precorrin-6A synthase (deacetylating) [Harenicola maris]